MRFKSRTSLKKFTAPKKYKSNTRSSLTLIFLVLIVLMQAPISLKATFEIMCLFPEGENTNKPLFFCNE